ncbi:MAG: ArsR/SmtB family transcription factor [Actinomadura sp.]
MLGATAAGPNTTEIARRLDISRAVVSQHTAILRNADLITSHRHGNSTLHVITRLGLALLRGAAHEARPPHGEGPPSAQRPRHGR